jgi:hypothetical protein
MWMGTVSHSYQLGETFFSIACLNKKNGSDSEECCHFHNRVERVVIFKQI